MGAAPARLTPALRNEYNSNGPSDPGPSRRMRTLIRHGTVVTAGRTVRADVLVDGEHVAAVAPSIEVPADRVIDATARYVLPGGVDAHTHMDLPMGSTVTAGYRRMARLWASCGVCASHASRISRKKRSAYVAVSATCSGCQKPPAYDST